MSKRKILFITERRADYSRLKPIMRGVRESSHLELQLMITGAHLLQEFGETKKVVDADGFAIDATLPMFSDNDADDGVSMVLGMSRALAGMADTFPRLNPDIVFCGFDLGAHLAAAITGMHLNIPVAHIQGGEVSGTIDEVLRHACTKFAHLHFVATKQSYERVIKLGENPDYVFLVGSPSLDTIKNIDYPDRHEMCDRFDLDQEKKLIIFLQHPVTTEVKNIEKDIDESIQALECIKKTYNPNIVAVYSNHDAGGRRIISALKQAGIRISPHIVYEEFLRLLNVADVLVGNSSTGIHEAPSFGLPTVNIGSRQQHRERGCNVIDVENNADAIYSSIEKSLADADFIRTVKQGKNPYDNGDTAVQVVDILEKVKLPEVQKVISY